MYTTTVLLASILLAQATPPDTTPGVPAVGVPVIASAASETEAAPAAPPTLIKLTPPEMVAEALVLPPGHSLQGSPLTLSDALSAATDKSRQSGIVHAYWQLVETVAVYRFSFDYNKQLTDLTTASDNLPQKADEIMLVSAAEASSTALLREAELAVVAAQHALAALALLPPNAPLPLPADRPHVGTYRTRFDELFATRPAPSAAVLIDRMLPIECLAVKGRASAVRAAEESLRATEEASRGGNVGVAEVAKREKERLQQRTAMIASVCRYNHDIADYALAVSQPGTEGKALVHMLIRVADETLRPVVSPADGQVQQAGLDEPIRQTPPRETRPSTNLPTLAPRPHAEAEPIRKKVPTMAPRPNGQAESINKNVPTLAPRPNAEAEPIHKNMPTLAPRTSEETTPIERDVPTPTTRPDNETENPSQSTPPLQNPWRASEPIKENAPTPAPPPDEPADATQLDATPAGKSRQPALMRPEKPSFPPAQPIVPARPIVPFEPEADDANPKADKPQANETQTDEPAVKAPAKQDSETRTAEKPIAGAEDSSTWRASGGLYTELSAATSANRAKQLTAVLHWNRKLPQSAGQSLTLAQCLQKCSPSDRSATVKLFWLTRQRVAEYQVMAQRVEMLDGLIADEGTVEVQLRLSARESADAAVHDAHVALLQSQFQLAALIGDGTSDRSWPLPSTVPHSGSYVLNLEAQPKQLTESWSFRRLAATLPALHDNVLDRAEAVVKADSARASAGNSTAAALDAIEEQTEQTLAFLRVLTDYNGTIADYALTVLPPSTSSERLVAALVLQ